MGKNSIETTQKASPGITFGLPNVAFGLPSMTSRLCETTFGLPSMAFGLRNMTSRLREMTFGLPRTIDGRAELEKSLGSRQSAIRLSK